MRGDALLDMILTNKEEIIRDMKAENSLCCGDHGMVEPGSWEERTSQKTRSLLWISEDILAVSEIWFEEPYGIWYWREKEVRRAAWFSRITSSKLKNCPPWLAENQAKKGKTEDPRNYRLIIAVPGKVLEEIILLTFSTSQEGDWRSQPGFMRGKSCLTILRAFYN